MESLISVDISPMYSSELSSIQDIINVLRGVNLDIDVPISKVRKLVDEQIKSSIEVYIVILTIKCFNYSTL